MSDKIKVSVLLDNYGMLLSEKQRNIMECYYYDDLSLSEISENEGITRQGVRDILKRCETSLIEYDNKLALIEKIGKLKKYSSAIDREVVKNNSQLKQLIDLIEDM